MIKGDRMKDRDKEELRIINERADKFKSNDKAYLHFEADMNNTEEPANIFVGSPGVALTVVYRFLEELAEATGNDFESLLQAMQDIHDGTYMNNLN